MCQHTSNTNLLKTRRYARSHALLAAGHTRARLRGSGALCGHVAGPGIAGREPGHPFYGVAERPGQDFNTTGWVQYYTKATIDEVRAHCPKSCITEACVVCPAGCEAAHTKGGAYSARRLLFGSRPAMPVQCPEGCTPA